MTACDWAACDAPALRQDDSGAWHCGPHWRDHLAFAAEEEARLTLSPSTRESVVRPVSEGYRNKAIAALTGVSVSRVNQLRRSEGVTDKPRTAKCGTRSGFQRHRHDQDDSRIRRCWYCGEWAYGAQACSVCVAPANRDELGSVAS